jgi:4-hydroxy-tetrahydrodipicolinate synthase
LADLPNVVAIKDSVSHDEYAELSRTSGDRILVSNPFEDRLLDNIVELGWKVYLASADAYMMQTPTDRRLQEYVDLALRGQVEQARTVRDSLEPVRQAMKSTRPMSKIQAHYKYWLELLGQVGGPVRRPLPQLTAEEKATIRAAFEHCGLQRPAPARV